MGRAVTTLTFMAGIVTYVHWQFRQVVGQITSPNRTAQHLTWGSAQARQESRTKCMICGGTGRSGFYMAVANGRGGTWYNKPCSACRGTGWVDNPMYGR